MNPSSSPCIVLTYGWGLNTPGGVARHIQELARALGDAGARVICVCISAADYSGFPRPRMNPQYEGLQLEKELAEHNVEVVRVAPHRLHWTLDGRPMKRAVERILDTEHVDCVLGFYNEAAYLPELCRQRSISFGYIATWLSYRMALSPARTGRGLRGLIMRRANRRFVIEPYREAQVLFANSEFTRSELVDVVGCNPDRIRVTYLGVKPFFRNIPRIEPKRIQRIVFFGRLVREKGIGDAITALGAIAAKGHRDWRLRILGSGNHDHVRRLADEQGIEPLIEMVPHQGDAGLADELAKAHLALLPSHSESFGLSIAEAQAAGLPVIAYDAGSVPEVVEDGRTAWLVPLHDTDALHRAIEEAMADPHAAHQRGIAGRERAQRLFQWSFTAERVLEGIRALRRAA